MPDQRQFKIGAWVEVKAVAVASYGEDRVRRILRVPLSTPFCGQIVGARHRQAGENVVDVVDGEQSMFRVNRFRPVETKLVWLIARGYTNTPIEAFAEDVNPTLVESGHKLPFRFARQLPVTPEYLDELREGAARQGRDQKGRFVKAG